jgi:diguanylate cyclase (GGDEF)-like protein
MNVVADKQVPDSDRADGLKHASDSRRLVRRVWLVGSVTVLILVGALLLVVNHAGNLASQMTLESEKRLISLEFDRMGEVALRNQRLIARSDELVQALREGNQQEYLSNNILEIHTGSFDFESSVYVSAGFSPYATVWLEQLIETSHGRAIIEGARDLIEEVHQKFDDVKIATRRGYIVPANVLNERLSLATYGVRKIERQLRIVLVQAVLPNSVINAGVTEHPPVVVSVLPISQEMLDTIKSRLELDNFHIQPLEVHAGPNDIRPTLEADGTATIAIQNGPSPRVVEAVWTPTSPQGLIFYRAAPVIVLIFLILAGGVGFISQRFARMLRALAESEALNRHNARHDPLTGLPNRAEFDIQLDNHLEKLRKRPFAMLAIDLDHFKQANDTYGHDAGDEVLRVAADRISAVVSPIGQLFRIGGDEFIALVTDVVDQEGLEFLGETIIETTCEPVMFEGHAVSIGASVGVAVGPANGYTGAEIMRAADEALYLSKDFGRGVVSFHNDPRRRRRRQSDRTGRARDRKSQRRSDAVA